MTQRTILLTALLLLWASLTATAQEESNEPLWSVNDATLVGAGGMNLMDTYLTPGAKSNYSGWTLRVQNERMKRVKLANYQVTRQQIVSIDGGRTLNAAGSAINYGFFLDYTLGYYYHLPIAVPGLKLLAGGAGHLLGGAIYNTRNSNNPVAAKVDLDLNLSAMALYNLRIKNFPLTLRYQATVPFAGIGFAPEYAQSYYELFGIGNSSGLVHFQSFHNKQAVKQYLTVDVPVGSITLRAGYLHSFYQTDINNIKSHIVTHTFMLGFVREFVAFGGKRAMNNKNIHKSTYY